MDIAPLLTSITPDVYNLPAIALDVETTFGDPLDPDSRLVLTSVYTEKYHRMRSYRCDEFNLPTELIENLEEDYILVGHNIKFDLQWLRRAGLDLTKVLVWDTMIGDKVILGNNPKYLPLDLGAVSKRYGYSGKKNTVALMMDAKICPSEISEGLLKNYCEQDVEMTYRIFLKQREIMRETGKLGVMLTRCLLTPVLADIEQNGMHLDKNRVMEEWTNAVVEMNEIDTSLEKIADINWNSTKQKAELLYEKFNFKELINPRSKKPLRTPSDKPRTDVDTIINLKCNTKKQEKLQELMTRRSKVSAKLTKNLDKYKECIDNDDIMQAEFNQHIAVTHRLTSTGRKYKSQFQNIPRIFKRLFTSDRKGWCIGECDGSGLEFRIAVELSQDKQGLIDLRNPEFDPHYYSASIINNIEVSLVSDDQRQDAKKHTFKPLFGGESGTDREVEYYKTFRNRYKQINDMQQKWMDEALDTKAVKLPWGMEFFFPHTKIQPSGYQTFKTNICNYPVQSFATAEIIPIAIVHLWHEIKARGLQCLLVNTVHDSIILIAPHEEQEELNEILVESFTTMCYNYVYNVYNMYFTTPLGVEIKWGQHWSEGKAFSKDVENNLIIEEVA